MENWEKKRKKSNPLDFSISFIFPTYISYPNRRNRKNVREGEKNKTTIKENVSINKKKIEKKEHTRAIYIAIFHSLSTLPWHSIILNRISSRQVTLFTDPAWMLSQVRGHKRVMCECW